MQRIPYFELGAIGDPITERGFRTLFRTCPRASDFAREAVNAVPEALAPAWGVSPAAIKVAILHEDGHVRAERLRAPRKRSSARAGCGWWRSSATPRAGRNWRRRCIG